jgi:hypothetical protein
VIVVSGSVTKKSGCHNHFNDANTIYRMELKEIIKRKIINVPSLSACEAYTQGFVELTTLYNNN